MAFTIGVVGGEMGIKYNHIIGVQDLSPVGQIIPFMLGLGQFIFVLVSIARGYIIEDEDDDNDCKLMKG
jgi:hypothetical protein